MSDEYRPQDNEYPNGYDKNNGYFDDNDYVYQDLPDKHTENDYDNYTETEPDWHSGRYQYDRRDSKQDRYYGGSGENKNPHSSKSAKFATASLILGIISIIMSLSCCLSLLSILPAIAGIICGVLAKNEYDRRESTAVAGIVCSIIAVVIFVIVTALTVFAGFGHSIFNGDEIYDEYDNWDYYDDYDDDFQHHYYDDTDTL